MNSDTPTRASVALLTALALTLAPAGCGGVAQVASEHRELVLQLGTASSNRDPKLLGEAAAEIDRLAASNGLSDDEENAFREILDAAQAGEWDRARDLAYALRDGQEPTAEDVERVAKRTLRPPKTLEPAKKPRR